MDVVTDNLGTLFHAAHAHAQRALSSIACAPLSTSQEHRCRRCRSLYAKLAALDEVHARYAEGGVDGGLLEECKALLKYIAELEAATDRVWPESNERQSPDVDLPLFDVSNDPFARPVASTAAASSKQGRMTDRDEPPRKRQKAGSTMSRNQPPTSPTTTHSGKFSSDRPTRRNSKPVFTPGVYYREPRSSSGPADDHGSAPEKPGELE
ncbi:hypothetical protein FB45DRAFT_923580 [Roridomyces roridus]|uniref:Uncharacterized protein n=1 Tax=Roridomyces roridus TaxID=1738132 RepID=A0AAD7BL48_9AGAR|nr:hypothetical protein FB45DRAFT_923580 [Roridomyces roridus]